MHVALDPRQALIEVQQARLGGAVPVVSVGQGGDVGFELQQSFGADRFAIGEIKEAAGVVRTLKVEQRPRITPAAMVEIEWNDETATRRHRFGSLHRNVPRIELWPARRTRR